MRNDFVRQMLVEMKNDPTIYFLTADLGWHALEPVERAFPERFINVGISEQHMVSMAAGLALEGKKVLCYSIASFATLRPYEAIRDDVCYHNLDVKIIGTGGGYNYPTHGATHHTVEDFAIMRVLPHMRVLAPAYSWEAREATKAMIRANGPFYMRLGKSPGVAFEKPSFRFALGKGYVVRSGEDIAIISTGNVLDIAVKTAEILHIRGIEACVVSMPTIKPIDEKIILKHAAKKRGIFTIEEHSVVGGLGSAVAETVLKAGMNGKQFDKFGLPADRFLKYVGDREYLLRKAGLDAAKIAARIQMKLRR